MKKILFFILLIFLIGACGNQNKRKKNSSDQIYIAKSDFFGIHNKIKIRELDSLINSMSIKRLNEYKTKDSVKNIAYKILIKELQREKIDTSGLLIKGVRILNDSLVQFKICHLDDIVYNQIVFEMDIIPPNMGNISGHEGWYTININKKTLKIRYEVRIYN